MPNWVKTSDRLPSEDGSYFVIGKMGRGSISFSDGVWNKYNPHFQVFVEVLEWLDESEPTFTISDLILAWTKAQEITIENTSYDVNAESVDPDYSYIEKERNDFFKKQFSVDINK